MELVTQVQIGIAVLLVIELVVLAYLLGKTSKRKEEDD